jgi:hypothetical protein
MSNNENLLFVLNKKLSGVGLVYYLIYVHKNNILLVQRHQERKKKVTSFDPFCLLLCECIVVSSFSKNKILFYN